MLKRTGIVLIIIIFFTNTITIAEESTKKRLFIQPYEVSIEKAAERARQTVMMLDDMYKTFIVLITKEYVKDPTMFSALILSKQVFKAMSDKGWHEARLLSTDGQPHNPDNRPKDDFEREATEALVSGKNYYDEVVKAGDNYYIRAATSMPAVMEGCLICHQGKKVGDLLGAISYKISLEEYFQ